MVDSLQSAHAGFKSQSTGGVPVLLFGTEANLSRVDLFEAIVRLSIKRVIGMITIRHADDDTRELGRRCDGPALQEAVANAGQSVGPCDSIGLEAVGTLEGFHGFLSAGAVVAVFHEGATVGIAESQLVHGLLKAADIGALLALAK
jgi:hypothetical protein